MSSSVRSVARSLTTAAVRTKSWHVMQSIRTVTSSGSRPASSANNIVYSSPDVPSEAQKAKEIIANVDSQIDDKSYGRLFAMLHLGAQQFKVTTGDLIQVDLDLGCAIGQKITLDKIMLIGSTDFTLVGRPLLPRDLCWLEATVVEKNVSSTEVTLKHTRKDKLCYTRAQFYKKRQTTLRITDLQLLKSVNNTLDRLGCEITDNKQSQR